MHFNDEEEEWRGKRLQHTALVLMENGDINFYNDFCFVYQIQGNFNDVYGSFENLYAVEHPTGSRGVPAPLPINCKVGQPHIWNIPTQMRNKAADTIKTTKYSSLLVKPPENLCKDLENYDLLLSTRESKSCL